MNAKRQLLRGFVSICSVDISVYPFEMRIAHPSIVELLYESMTTLMTIDEQLAYLAKGTTEIIREAELRAKLEKSAATGKPLRVKLGADPTAPDIHLGHTVVIRKLRAFQELGHTAIFLIGDFTGLIGDPSGKSATRPQLTREEINANAETYKQQIFKLLDPEKTVIDFNSRWMDTLGSAGFLRLVVARHCQTDSRTRRFSTATGSESAAGVARSDVSARDGLRLSCARS